MQRFQTTYFTWDFSDFKGDHQDVFITVGQLKLWLKTIKFISRHGEIRMYLTMYKQDGENKYEPLDFKDRALLGSLKGLLGEMPSGSWLQGGLNMNNNMGIVSYFVKKPRNMPTREIVLQIFDEIAVVAQRPDLLDETFLFFDVYQQTSIECKRKDRDDPQVVPYSEYLILNRRGFLTA